MPTNEPKTISKLLRAIAGGTEAQKNGHDVILIAAAEMIDAFDRKADRAANEACVDLHFGPSC